MANKAPLEIPIGMRRVWRRFERWRKGHKVREPFSEALWASAAEAAREHGVFQTAKVLRLEYGKLKRMVEAAPSSRRPTVGHPPEQAMFLELAPSSGASFGSGHAECLIELEGPRGKIRIQWKGTTGPDLAGLSRALWEPA
jgi:hypothetical protein